MKTDYHQILQLVYNLDLSNYAKSRNFINGSVSMLSPYISRGLLSTKIIVDHLSSKYSSLTKFEKFIQELAWRDYWQIVWKYKNINNDIKRKQLDVRQFGIPTSILNASTGIEAVDKSVNSLYETGYVHNHARMYISSIICNIAKCHWKIPAQWFYYHLLDGDWGSNALSWQWVSGTNSSKKYYANQSNINLFCHTNQKNTFLDIDYDQLTKIDTPVVLKEVEQPILETTSINFKQFDLDFEKPLLIYNYYNVDPKWKCDLDANRVFLIEPSILIDYPIGEKAMNFTIELAKNISGINFYFGSFNNLVKDFTVDHIYYKEHPLNSHYRGNMDHRDWIFQDENYYSSFFKFWNSNKQILGF